MSPDELALSKQALEVFFSPVRDVCSRLTGAPADEVAAMMATYVRVYHWKLAVRLLQDVKQTAKNLGIELGKVPLKTLFPILEGFARRGM